MRTNFAGRLKGAVFLGLAFILWMFGPKVPLDRHFAKDPTGDPVTIASHATSEVPASVTDLTTPTPPALDLSTSKVIRKCLPDLEPTFTSRNFSLNELIDYLRSSRTAHIATEVENLHVTTNDGTELRLMISPSDSTEFDGPEAYLFSVDQDGLPVPEKLPLHIDPRDIAAAKKHFLGLGNLVFHETTYVYTDEANKVTGKFTYSFDELSSAELAQDGKFLGCAKSISSDSVACKCL